MTKHHSLYHTDTAVGERVIVFLHYFGGSTKTWNNVVNYLADRYRCIAIDLPGFGQSKEIHGELSVNKMADVVHNTIHSLAIKNYILVGHSMGGKIAMAVAANYPAEINGLILMAPSPPTPEPMTAESRKRLLDAHGNTRAMTALLRMVCGPAITDKALDDTVRDNIIVAETSWKWWLDAGSKENISGQMSKIKVPVYVIAGENDPNLGTHFLTKSLTPFFPTAQFTEIPEAGHLLPVEAPESLAKSMLSFLPQIL